MNVISLNRKTSGGANCEWRGSSANSKEYKRFESVAGRSIHWPKSGLTHRKGLASSKRGLIYINSFFYITSVGYFVNFRLHSRHRLFERPWSFDFADRSSWTAFSFYIFVV